MARMLARSSILPLPRLKVDNMLFTSAPLPFLALPAASRKCKLIMDITLSCYSAFANQSLTNVICVSTLLCS